MVCIVLLLLDEVSVDSEMFEMTFLVFDSQDLLVQPHRSIYVLPPMLTSQPIPLYTSINTQARQLKLLNDSNQ